MIERARTLTGRAIPSEVVARRPGDPAVVLASAGLAGELLGWKARHSDLDTLLTTTWKAYQAHEK
jgi:UDP-glucose 4-epimerase